MERCVECGTICPTCDDRPKKQTGSNSDLSDGLSRKYVIQDQIAGHWVDQRATDDKRRARSIRSDMQRKSPTKVRIIERFEREIE